MARTIQETGSKNLDQSHDQLAFQAHGADRIDLPSSDFISDAKMAREGDDLILHAPNGETAVIEGYFSTDPAPTLHSPDGAALTPNLVQAFVHSPLEFAANDTASDQSPVGAVEEVKGNATVTRADGTVETITDGTPIYQGDVVETDAQGAVNIVFVDETSMAVSANARLAIDEYTYDPSTESGTTNFSVLRGLFVFTSGLIGRDDPDDVKIDTPVGSIGIRGTIIAGEIHPGGESNISVLEGAIVIKNGTGETTLSHQFETVRLAGFDQPIHEMGVVPASDINSRFSSMSDVNASLFTMINDAVKEQAHTPAPEAPKTEAAPEPTSSNDQTSHDTNTATNDTGTSQPSLPDILAPIDSSVPTLNTGSSTGLPSTSTVTGQPSAGLTATASTAVASGSVVTDATAAAPSASAGTSPPSPTSTTAATSTVSTTDPQPLPPTSTTTTAPTTPTAPVGPTLTFTGGTFNDITAASTVLGTINGGANVSYAFASGSNANGYYSLVTNGTGVNVVLTTVGHATLAASLAAVDLGDFSVVATDTVTGAQTTQLYNTDITDANASKVVNLDATATGVVKITDSLDNEFGYTISALGDTNHDGFDDFAVSNNSGNTAQNHIYKFEGRLGQYAPADLGDSSLTSIMSTHANPTTGAISGTTVTGIGDFNGDGIADYAIGQPGANAGALDSGNVAIVSGTTGTLSFGTGIGASADLIGYSIDGIGDFNSDGYADVIVGAPGIDEVLLIRGNNTSWTGTLNGNSTPVTGTANSGFGTSVAGLGDFDGDGFADFAVGAPADDTGGTDAGLIKIYSGREDGTLVSTRTIAGTTANMKFGSDLFSLGDINGDGKTDLMVGSANGGHILLGGSTAVDANFNVPTNYKVLGGGGVGDFNGDGYDDFTISLGDNSGSKTYLVFGKQGWSGNYDLDFFKDPQNALELKYSATDANSKLEINGVGDINGDGYDDFAIGVPDANGAAAGNGGLYLVYGRDTGSVTGGVTASANNQHLVGTQNNDVLNDGGFNGVSMHGGAGRDVFGVSNTNFLDIDGGGNLVGSGMSDYDRIDVFGANTSLDFTNVNFEKMSGIEGISFADNNQTIKLTMENLFNLMRSSDDGMFRITAQGVSGMNLVLTDDNGTDNYAGGANTDTEISALLGSHTNGTVAIGSQTESAVNYRTFDIGGYTLLIDNTIAVDAQ